MPRTRTTRSLARPATAVVLTLVAAFAIMASGVLGRSGSPTPSSPPSTPKPTPTASPSAPAPTPVPSAPVGDGTTVDLDNRGGFDILLRIKDRTGRLVTGSSGTPKDGMSVRWHDAIVKNVDASTIRITWAGWPRDEEVGMTISRSGDKVRIHIVQIAPYPNTDAMGLDRILDLTFDGPIDADDVKVTFEDVSPA